MNELDKRNHIAGQPLPEFEPMQVVVAVKRGEVFTVYEVWHRSLNGGRAADGHR